MKIPTKLTVSLFAAILSSGSALAFSFVSNVTVTVKQSGNTVLNQSYSFNQSYAFNGEVGYPRKNVYDFKFEGSYTAFSTRSNSATANPAPEDSSGETIVDQSLRFKVSTTDRYAFYISTTLAGYAPSGFAEATLFDETTGQILAESRSTKAGDDFGKLVRLDLIANRSYLFVGRASTFVQLGDRIGGRAAFSASLGPNTVVPEPGSLALLAGAGIVGLRRRRSRK